MRDSAIFYKTFYDCIKELSEGDGYALYDAVFQYAFYGVEPELSGLCAGIFAMIKVQIDANNKRYENGKKGAEHGKKGGRPKKSEEKPEGDILEETEKTPEGIEGEKTKNPKGVILEETEKTPNDNVNVNENDNVNEKKETPKGVKKKFVPPTIEEIRDYCEQNHKLVDAEEFFCYYDSRGWKSGKNKIERWKSAVSTWDIRKRKEREGNGRIGGNALQNAKDTYTAEFEQMLSG